MFRDPWWVAACLKLLWVLKGHYDLSLREVVTVSPRFAVMLTAMFLSIVFVLMDILSVTAVLDEALPVGVNPFWKLGLVFKCLTDTVVLDDFKTALDRLWTFRRTSLPGSGDPLAPGAGAHTARQPGDTNRNRTKTSTGREHSGYVRFEQSPSRRGPDFGHYEMQPPAPTTARV